MIRKILVKLCNLLEKHLYDAPTYDELSRELDTERYKLSEAHSEAEYLRSLLR